MKPLDFESLQTLSEKCEGEFLGARAQLLHDFLQAEADHGALRSTQFNIERLREISGSPQGAMDELWQLISDNIRTLKSLAEKLRVELEQD